MITKRWQFKYRKCGNLLWRSDCRGEGHGWQTQRGKAQYGRGTTHTFGSLWPGDLWEKAGNSMPGQTPTDLSTSIRWWAISTSLVLIRRQPDSSLLAALGCARRGKPGSAGTAACSAKEGSGSRAGVKELGVWGEEEEVGPAGRARIRLPARLAGHSHRKYGTEWYLEQHRELWKA